MSTCVNWKWKPAVDKGKSFGALLTELWKAFDRLPHDLLIANFNSHGFSLNALRWIHSFLFNRRQRAKINESYRSWEETLFGIPQGSIIGPFLFNIFMCDLFGTVNEIDGASYADDNTPFASGYKPDDVLSCLENASLKLFYWFSNN